MSFTDPYDEGVIDSPAEYVAEILDEMDMVAEAEPVPSEPSSAVPEGVTTFITSLRRAVQERNITDIQDLYDNTFSKLTDRYYKNASWPAPDYAASLVENDATFMILYKELYFRHIYARLQASIDNRFDSWENYTALFNLVLNADDSFALDLPDQWIFDMLDEFVYQFQSFCQWRHKTKNRTPEEIARLKQNGEVYHVRNVLITLHKLAAKVGIQDVLSKGDADAGTGGTPFAQNRTLKMFGFFSLVGIARTHCLLGDYTTGLHVLEHVDLTSKGLFACVPACHITLFYYVGFSYLMQRRYMDAILTFSNILLYINRTERYHSRSYQYETMMKRNEQMFALLTVALAMCPQRVDENLHATLRDKYTDKMLRMQRGDENAFEEVFQYACPKFVNPAVPDFDAEVPTNANQETYRTQLRVFLQDIKQQSMLPTIRSYLKLYTSIPVSKLASFTEMDEQSIHNMLLCYKHKTHNRVWSSGTLASGTRQSHSDIDFYVQDGMIHVLDSKPQKRYIEYFAHLINELTAGGDRK